MDLHMMPPPPHLQPRIVIIEQPQQRGMRFRYECEGRSAGSIPGENTTKDRRTWPAIQILHYTGNVTVRVSLVSKDNPPRSHPHSLVGKDCAKGICSVTVNAETQMTAIFSNLGIQCVRRREVADALRLRQSLNVDPFNTHQSSDPQAVDIDLNIVRLCFEAFISQGSSHLVLQPVVSNSIFDKKATCSAMLRICRVDKSFGGCKGGDEVYLLCDKVQKDDISICFFELESNWEANGEFSPTDVHRQVAVVFRTPPYRNTNIREATKVLFHLKRSSDGEISESKEFTYLPSQHVQPRMRQNSDHAIKRRFDENQTTLKRNLRDQLLRSAPKQDPSYDSRRTGDGRYTLSQSLYPTPTRPFPSMNPPQPTVDNSSSPFGRMSNNFQLTSSRMPRMEQPQHNMYPQSADYWPPSVMQPRTQPMAVTHHSFAPSMPNATNSIQRGAMAQSPGPQPLPMPASLSFVPPITMASTSTMLQGAIVPSPHPPQTIDLAELDGIDLSFGDLGKFMYNLSIEPGTTFSDLIKTEPELSESNMHPFPNTIHPPTDQQRPNVNIQAPSPQQFQQVNSPAQYVANARDVNIQAPSPQQFQQVNPPAHYVANAREMEEQNIMTGLFPGYDNDHLPSYDLESQLPSTSQNEIEDLVED